MIRLVKIGDQIYEGNDDFAWYDTVTDEFISFADQIVFESWVDFETSFKLSGIDADVMIRFKSLWGDVNGNGK